MKTVRVSVGARSGRDTTQLHRDRQPHTTRQSVLTELCWPNTPAAKLLLPLTTSSSGGQTGNQDINLVWTSIVPTLTATTI